MTYHDITVFYLDGTKEAYCGGYEIRENRLHIYTQHDGIVKIPFTSIKKYIIK